MDKEKQPENSIFDEEDNITVVFSTEGKNSYTIYVNVYENSQNPCFKVANKSYESADKVTRLSFKEDKIIVKEQGPLAH